MTEKFANNAISTLNGAINNSVTTLTVTDASSFPSSGNFRIGIDSEILLVTAVSGNDFTVTRGHESTTAASHSDLAPVRHILTAGAMNTFRADNIQSNTYANLPTAEKAGRLYLPTNSHYDYLYDNGSSWDHFIKGKKVTPPVSGDFAWVNQGSATIVTTNGGIYLEAPSGADNVRGMFEDVPTDPYTKTILIVPNIPVGDSGYPNCGIALYDGTKVWTFGVGWRQDATAGPNNVRGSFIEITEWSAVDTFSAEVFVYPGSYFGPIWLRIEDNSTNRKASISYDGINFIEILSESRTSFLTPTKIGFIVNPASGSFSVGMNVLGWE